MADEVTPQDVMRVFSAAMKDREEHGRHRHHRHCIHNLPPEEQIAMRGKTVDWWMKIVGFMPEQITPEQWECEPPGEVS